MEVLESGKARLPPRPVLTLMLASEAGAGALSASPTATAAAAATTSAVALVALVAWVSLAAVIALSCRATAGYRTGTAPGLIRMLGGSVVPVSEITGTGSGPAIARLVHPVHLIPGPVPGEDTELARTRD
jgi:hypothetical protein